MPVGAGLGIDEDRRALFFPNVPGRSKANSGPLGWRKRGRDGGVRYAPETNEIFDGKVPKVVKIK